MKKITILIVMAMLCFFFRAIGQVQNKPPNRILRGTVISSSNKTALQGANITYNPGGFKTLTDNDGHFSIGIIDDRGVLSVSFIGYQTKTLKLDLGISTPLVIQLEKDSTVLTEVIISTGYQAVAKERVTGSVVQIDNTLYNRSVGSNILDRLNGVTSGLLSDGLALTTPSTGPSFRTLGLNIRGTSTLSDKVNTDPLIVLDGFPYEGDINNLNPNDVENVSVLKDAAAASIWGARSGNGVIVITTKKGRRNQPLTIQLNTNIAIQNKPDVYRDKSYLSVNDYIDLETQLFDKGYYDSYLTDIYTQPAVSPVIDILNRQRSGSLSLEDAQAKINHLRSNDVRRDFEKYIYRKSVKQQYALSMRGGSAQNRYVFSGGYDHNQDNLVRNGYHRFTLSALNTYNPIKGLDITTAVNYSQNKTINNNRISWGGGDAGVGGAVTGLYPYAAFAGSDGTHLATVKDYSPEYAGNAQSMGLMDWQYRPLDELALGDYSTRLNDLLLRSGLKYRFANFLDAELQFQQERQVADSRRYRNEKTYYARNLINKFTLIDPTDSSATYQFPRGGVLNLSRYDLVSTNYRGQLNYDQQFLGKHHITGLLGAEVRQLRSTAYSRTSYGYNEQFGTSVTNLNYRDYLEVNPVGNIDLIPNPEGDVTGTLNRYVSYFVNAAYVYDNRYTLTLSARRDGANIFGVKTNDKITPLWSAGLGWNISRENFYKLEWIPYLNARFSYGYNGNVYNGSAYVTGKYGTSSLTGASVIEGLTAPNPYLRWEKVKNINAGIDFSTRNNRLSGTFEWYQKNGEDLIQNILLNPSSGFYAYFGNAAATTTKGVDITLNSRNLTGTFNWNTNVLLSTLRDKVTAYDVALTSSSFRRDFGTPVEGRSLYGLYSYRWSGLDPVNGDPQGYLNGQVSKDYAAITGTNNPDSLIYNGSSRPTVYGALRNDFSWKQFSLSVNISFRLGYYFRRTSTAIDGGAILSGSNGQHVDYANRWQQPGDEVRTQVPSVIYPGNATRNTFYQYADVLVSNAGNIRLQDIRLAYELTKKQWLALPFERIQLYTYCSNLGILWRANKFGLDPDLVAGGANALAVPFQISFGFNATF